jgi:hypothetical protein
MKSWGVAFALFFVSVLVVVDMVHEFISNDAIDYFSSRPKRLLLVAAVAIGGGVLAEVLDRLSHRAKRAVRLAGWGAAATFVTCFSVYCVYESFAVSPMVSAAAGQWPFLLLLMFASFAAYLWFEFYRAWKNQIRV